MALVQIDWRPGPRALRRFGLTMLVGFGLLGAAFFAGWPVPAVPALGVGLWAFGGLAGLLGLSGTILGLPLYWAWMGVAFVLGNLTSRVALVLTWALVVTPVALLGRLVGRDRLALRRGRRDTYWCDLPPPGDKGSYERQS